MAAEKVGVAARLVAKPERRGELVEALRGLVEAAREEAGTELYLLHEAAGDDDTVWVYELYADQDALSAHSSSEAMKVVGARLADILAGPPELILLRPVDAKGARLQIAGASGHPPG
ncbi:MAG TPA: putative quinol monooxygenase [Acidimicrobiales bacterium]|nr:putative quinol monooxygenase [Acidimicrobiales bacterium]